MNSEEQLKLNRYFNEHIPAVIDNMQTFRSLVLGLEIPDDVTVATDAKLCDGHWQIYFMQGSKQLELQFFPVDGSGVYVCINLDMPEWFAFSGDLKQDTEALQAKVDEWLRTAVHRK